MATVMLPRMLANAANTAQTHPVEGATVDEALVSLFVSQPGLRGHIVDETGAIRPHVSVFVDGARADLESPLGPNAAIRILQAVSGGSLRTAEAGSGL